MIFINKIVNKDAMIKFVNDVINRIISTNYYLKINQ